MDKWAKQRRWYQLHFLTWTTLFFSSYSLAHYNVAGDWAKGSYTIRTVRKQYGWPFVFVKTKPRYDGWVTPIWEADFDADPQADVLTLDLLICLATLGGTAFTVEKWSRRGVISVSLKGIMAFTGFAASALWLLARRWTRLDHLTQSGLWALEADAWRQIVADAGIVASIALSWLAFFDLLEFFFNWLTRKRRSSS